MVFGVSQRDAQIPYKRIPFGAREDLHTKGLEIRTTNSITKKYLKCPQGPLHCIERIETIPTDKLFASFGALVEKILKRQN